MLSSQTPTTPNQNHTSQDKNILGTLLNNRYAIQKVIGRGGIGITYLAHDSYQFNDPCVIKEFVPFRQKNQQYQKLKGLFIREAKILYQLDHPQIPKFYAYFESEERLFIVQEYIQGQSYAQLLKQRLKQGKTFSESEIFSWLKNMLGILEYIHQRGIIHRDISPDNIMQPKGRNLPMLIDFGVGKQCNDSSPNKIPDNLVKTPHEATVVGKIGYAAHEQLQFGECSPCSDLYSLGVSTISLLTGKKPNQLINYSLEWQWRNYIKVHDDLARIIDRLIAYNPAERYQSAKEVLIALNFLHNVITKTHSCDSVVDILNIEESKIQSLASEDIEATKLLSFVNSTQTLTAEFINRCQKELAYCIGPMANIIIEEVLVDSSGLPKEKFVEAIAINIPYWKKRQEFCRKIAV